MHDHSKIILADDHAIVREGLKMLIATISDVSVVGEAADGKGVFEVLSHVPADLLILDLGMPGVEGYTFIRKIASQWPNLKILILTANVDPRSARESFGAGAHGYLTKSGDPSEFLTAIESMRNGNRYIAEDVRFTINTAEPSQKLQDIIPANLTPREQQYLSLIPHVASNREIAERLGISLLTARKHRENLMRKLALRTSNELTAYAVRLGLSR